MTDDTTAADAPRGDAPGAATTTGADAPAARKLPRWRRIVVGLLVVVVCVLAPIAVVGVWVRNTLLHTDQYVDTMAPLSDNPDIQQAVANRVGTAVANSDAIEAQVEDLLPTRAQRLAPVIMGGLEEVARAAALKIVESDAFDTLWREMNRRAHTRVVGLLRGKGPGNVETKNGEITVTIEPILEKVKSRVSFLSSVDTSSLDAPIVLFKSEDLRKIQGATDLLDRVANFLPFILLALLAVAIALSGNRRRTVLRAALGIAFAMALLLVILNVARNIYLDSLPKSVNQDAARAVYEQVLSFLRLSLRTSLVVALLVAIGAWIAGPGRVATRIRRSVRGTKEVAPGETASGLSTFVYERRNALRIAVVAIGALILILLQAPSPVGALFIAVLVVVGLVVIELLGRDARAVAARDTAPVSPS
ncbi:MAG TPA: hypothetical protein VH986_06350 [Acidimicrobiia bacterium]|jgi:hypothetical protein